MIALPIAASVAAGSNRHDNWLVMRRQQVGRGSSPLFQATGSHNAEARERDCRAMQAYCDGWPSA